MKMSEEKKQRPKNDIPTILSRVKRPKKAVITAGMPYANGPLHIGHLAGAHVPADIYARFMRMVIGKDNVLFVNGTDDHGSNAAVAAKKQGNSTEEFVEEIHKSQKATLDRYGVSVDVYTGTSRKENFEAHKEYCQEILRKLHDNQMLNKRTTEQWYDTELEMFLPDRYVYGDCPNCDNQKAYSDECDECGAVYEPKELQNPKSTVSDATPVLKATDHWWLDMWKVSDELKSWIEGKKKTWGKNLFAEVFNTVLPCIIFSNTHEDVFKSLKESLPKHKSRYAPGKKIVVQFDSLGDLNLGQKLLKENGVESELVDGWAHRSITRDVAWGIPIPHDKDPNMKGKSFYVWPESLVAPIGFTKVALKEKGLDPELYKDYWCDPEADVYQFLGQDNVYFYVLMQGAMWFGSQNEIHRMPKKGELQLSDVFSRFHLQIEGKKMSKSTGNFLLAKDLLEDYHPDQLRYFLALLSLFDKPSNFDFETFKERNKFLAGPLNAAMEKPISAAHSKFDGKVPAGKLIGKTEKETLKIIQIYTNSMAKGDYSKLLFAIENYARIINGLFNQYKPHDDRGDLSDRSDALYSSFYILKNLLIMLSPFAPKVMDKLRQSLNLPEEVLSIDELGVPLEAGHMIGEKTEYFPAAGD